MEQYTENNITFRNVLTPQASFGSNGPKQLYKKSDRTFTSDYLDSRNVTDTDKMYELFSTNAIDIHWGGANINGTTVNTTAQLLKIIANLQTKVDQLETAFSTLATNVGALVTITNG